MKVQFADNTSVLLLLEGIFLPSPYSVPYEVGEFVSENPQTHQN